MMRQWLIDSWYKPRKTVLAYGLYPISLIYRAAVAMRRYGYRLGLLSSKRFSVPIVVVGNLTVGGTGKTPLVQYLADLFKRHGFFPGIVARGYGAYKRQHDVQEVTHNSHPDAVGDEPCLLHKRTLSPVFVAAHRNLAVSALLRAYPQCNVILSDDGLQHLAMQRDLEIVVIDGKRGLGNALCLPAGPLREPKACMRDVDFCIVTEGKWPGAYSMRLIFRTLYSMKLKTRYDDLSAWKGRELHAVAGIGHPERFFELLQSAGLCIKPHIFPDHYAYTPDDLRFPDQLPIVMTEKDAVKCREFADTRYWVCAVSAELPKAFDQAVLSRLASCTALSR